MRILTFAPEHGRHVDLFDSEFVQVLLARSDGASTTSSMFLPGGRIGPHQATRADLFYVIAGSGFVSGHDGEDVPISAFQAALWEAGEHHGARTDAGMTAITLEADGFQLQAPRPCGNRSGPMEGAAGPAFLRRTTADRSVFGVPSTTGR